MQSSDCFKHFKERRVSDGEAPGPRQCSTSTHGNHVNRVCVAFCGNHLTVREVANDVGIRSGSWHQIWCRVCWLTIVKRTALKPVKYCLLIQMVMETFWRTPLQEMRHGLLVWGMLCAGRDLNNGKTLAGCCSMTVCWLMHCSSSAVTWQSIRQLLCPSTLFSRLSPSRTFPGSWS